MPPILLGFSGGGTGRYSLYTAGSFRAFGEPAHLFKRHPLLFGQTVGSGYGHTVYESFPGHFLALDGVNDLLYLRGGENDCIYRVPIYDAAMLAQEAADVLARQH